MEIIHAARMDWGESLVAHRQGNVAHKRLFEGQENTPDNFALVLANEGSDFYSPRHRHNWDQVRLCIEGRVPIGRDMSVSAGEIGYFPEGVPYGPQEGGPDRLVLVLQVGGASGQGYMSTEQLRRGYRELLQEGEFEKGVFRRTRGEGKKNQDAYEAIWQHVFGRPIAYPEPRYAAPVVVKPDNFTARSEPDAPGVARKWLATFPERGLMLDIYSIAAGSHLDLGQSPARRLAFVLAGDGECAGESYEEQSTIHLLPGEAAAFTAARETTVFIVTMALIAAD